MPRRAAYAYVVGIRSALFRIKRLILYGIGLQTCTSNRSVELFFMHCFFGAEQLRLLSLPQHTTLERPAYTPLAETLRTIRELAKSGFKVIIHPDIPEDLCGSLREFTREGSL